MPSVRACNAALQKFTAADGLATLYRKASTVAKSCWTGSEIAPAGTTGTPPPILPNPPGAALVQVLAGMFQPSVVSPNWFLSHSHPPRCSWERQDGPGAGGCAGEKSLVSCLNPQRCPENACQGMRERMSKTNGGGCLQWDCGSGREAVPSHLSAGWASGLLCYFCCKAKQRPKKKSTPEEAKLQAPAPHRNRSCSGPWVGGQQPAQPGPAQEADDGETVFTAPCSGMGRGNSCHMKTLIRPK